MKSIILLAIIFNSINIFSSEKYFESLTVYNESVRDEFIQLSYAGEKKEKLKIKVHKSLEFGTVKQLDFTITISQIPKLKIPKKDYGDGKGYWDASVYSLTREVGGEFYKEITSGEVDAAVAYTLTSPFIFFITTVVDTMILTPGSLVVYAVNGPENQHVRNEWINMFNILTQFGQTNEIELDEFAFEKSAVGFLALSRR